MLLAQHGSCSLMDRLVMIVKELAVFLFYPSGTIFEFSNRMEEEHTNNQVEYEVLLFGLKFLESMGVKM